MNAATDRENPWPGLASFTEETRALFHGRDEEIGELSRRVQRKLLTILFGQSGHGKTSILRAGVVPRLRNEGYCPIYVRIDYGRDAAPPSVQIQQAIARAVEQSPASVAGESLWEFLHHRDAPLRDAAGRELIPLVIFDQFEELFTLGQADDSARERAAVFMEELADLVENRAPRAVEAKLEQDDTILDRFDFGRSDYRILISLREDYLPQLEMLKGRMPSITQNRMRLAQMTGTQALDAVQKPGGALVTPEVARAIVEFVSGARGGSIERLAELSVEPPLLSVICRELNERRRALGQAQITADLVTGNRREILTDFYERSVADLPEAMRRFVEDKLLTKSGFRDNLALETALEEPGVTKPLIDTLVSRRLLRLEDRIGAQRVELSHDVLADVVRGSRDVRQQRLASLAAAHRTRRQYFIIAGLSATVIALLIGAFFGIRAQRNSALQASQTDLVLGSRLLDEKRLGEGLAYLARAGAKDPGNPLIAPRILTTLVAHNFALPFGTPLALPTPALGGSFSSDGKWLLLQGEDDVVRIINATDWKIERELAFGQKIRRYMTRGAEKNPNLLAAMLVDGSIVVCDFPSGRPRFTPLQAPESLREGLANLALSPNGRWVAASSASTAWVWDAQTGELRATLANDGSYHHELAFSPDDQRIITVHGDRRAQMWSLPDGKPVGDFLTPRARVIYLAKFSRDGSRWMLWHSTGVTICNAQTGLPIGPDIPLNYVSTQNVWLSPDGNRLLYASDDRTVNVLDVTTGKPVFAPLMHGGLILQADIRADGSVLFTNSVDGYFRMWDMDTGRLLAEPTWKQDRFTPAACAPDGTTVAVFTNAGPVYRLRLGRGAYAPLVLPRPPGAVAFANLVATPPARLWWLTPEDVKVIDLASARIVEGGFRFPAPVLGQGGGMRSGYGDTLSAGQHLIARIEGKWHSWTWGDRGIARDVELQNVPARASNFVQNPVGSLAINYATEDARTLGIWNKNTGALLATINAIPAGWSAAGLISPDETRVAVRTMPDQAIKLFDTKTGRELFTLQLSGRERFAGFRFNADGSQLLTGDTWGGVQAWDLGTAKLIRSTPMHRTSITRFELSSDGNYYISLSTDGSAQVWDARTHLPVGDMLNQGGRAVRATFSPRGNELATPSTGGTARIWDIRSGLPLTEPLEHLGESVSIPAYSPDGTFLTTLTDAGTNETRYNYVWPAPPDGHGARTPKWLLKLATIAAGRRVTTEGKFTVAVEEFGQIEEIRREIAASDGAYAEWARWFLSDQPTRPIAPGFTATPAEAKALRDRLAVVESQEALSALLARAGSLRNQDRLEELETLDRRIVERTRREYGPESPNLGSAMANLAVTLLRLRKYEDAERFASQSLALREKLNSPAFNVGNMRAARGQALLGLGRHTEAEPLLLAGYEVLKSSTSRDRILETANALATLYEAMGNTAKAEEWKRIATAVPPRQTKKQ